MAFESDAIVAAILQGQNTLQPALERVASTLDSLDQKFEHTRDVQDDTTKSGTSGFESLQGAVVTLNQGLDLLAKGLHDCAWQWKSSACALR